MELDFYHVDAFSECAFKGNPAAVFVLQSWLSDELMQAIANEFNLSETVFSVWEEEHYRIRWFTPEAEIPLCGHATVATSHVLYQHMGYRESSIPFMSLSGPLSTSYEQGVHTLDFPANPAKPVFEPTIKEIVAGPILETLTCARKLIVIVESEEQVKSLQPDFLKIAKLPYRGVCVTARASSPNIDFVCRFFAPAIGINEDPVTGNIYTILGPYYAQLTGKNVFNARQLSKRSGDVGVVVQGDRVLISGKAHTVMHGKYYLDNL